jgi:Uma2 family endonuclease
MHVQLKGRILFLCNSRMSKPKTQQQQASAHGNRMEFQSREIFARVRKNSGCGGLWGFEKVGTCEIPHTQLLQSLWTACNPAVFCVSLIKVLLMAKPAYTPPPRTILEVYQNLPEGTLAQLIHNQIYMSPSPTNAHQKVLDKIYRRLGNYVEEKSLGETRVAPFDVHLNRRNVYQPDIMFIANENLPELKEDGFHGAPDLVIEILSPGTWRFDKEDKKDEYERSGVKEYWMIDPSDKTTEGFTLQNGEFKLLPSEKGQLTLQLFPFTITF